VEKETFWDFIVEEGLTMYSIGMKELQRYFKNRKRQLAKFKKDEELKKWVEESLNIKKED